MSLGRPGCPGRCGGLASRGWIGKQRFKTCELRGGNCLFSVEFVWCFLHHASGMIKITFKVSGTDTERPPTLTLPVPMKVGDNIELKSERGHCKFSVIHTRYVVSAKSAEVEQLVELKEISDF